MILGIRNSFPLSKINSKSHPRIIVNDTGIIAVVGQAWQTQVVRHLCDLAVLSYVVENCTGSSVLFNTMIYSERWRLFLNCSTDVSPLYVLHRDAHPSSYPHGVTVQGVWHRVPCWAGNYDPVCHLPCRPSERNRKDTVIICHFQLLTLQEKNTHMSSSA